MSKTKILVEPRDVRDLQATLDALLDTAYDLCPPGTRLALIAELPDESTAFCASLLPDGVSWQAFVTYLMIAGASEAEERGGN